MSGGTRLRATAGGSVTMVADDTLTTDEVVVVQDPIGVNQTWQDLTASRALKTVYTNNTGRTIMVAMHIKMFPEFGCSIVVDGVEATSYYSPSGMYETFSPMAIIPPGSTYEMVQVNNYVGDGSQYDDMDMFELFRWTELR